MTNDTKQRAWAARKLNEAAAPRDAKPINGNTERKVRRMFDTLFDDTAGLSDRVQAFIWLEGVAADDRRITGREQVYTVPRDLHVSAPRSQWSAIRAAFAEYTTHYPDAAHVTLRLHKP